MALFLTLKSFLICKARIVPLIKSEGITLILAPRWPKFIEGPLSYGRDTKQAPLTIPGVMATARGREEHP